MKNVFFGAVALIALPLSVQAGQLLPNLYAKVYCESRAMGMSEEASVTQAVSESYISRGNGISVTVHGVKTTTDVVAAMREARNRCPQYK
jgi:hypothetical protein